MAIVTVLRVLLILYLGVLLLACVLQRKAIFPAGRDIWRTPQSVGWAYEDLTLPVGDETTNAWYIPAPNARGVVLFSHGNGGTISDRLESAAIFRGLGFDVLLYDYGGYGKSTGKPSELRCYADARAMWEYLTKTRNMPPEHIVLFGESLGGAVTVDLASQVRSRAVILASTFLSAAKVGQEIVPFLPIGLILRYRFESEKKIGKITAPVLVIHSPEDDVIPYHHGQDLYRLANEPKSFLEIRGNHNEGFFVSGALYEDGLRDFLDSVVSSAP